MATVSLRRWLQRIPSRGHVTIAVSLILLAIVPLAMLAYRTSVRQHEMEVALLQSEAFIAAQRFGSHVSIELYNGANAILRPIRGGRFAATTGADDPRIMFAAADSAERCGCVPLLRPTFVFRTDLTPSGTEIEGAATDSIHANWLVARVQDVLRSLKGGWDIALISELDPHAGTLVFLSRRQTPQSTTVYGFGVDTATINRGVIANLLSRARVMRESIYAGGEAHAVSLQLVDKRGVVAFATETPIDRRYSARAEIGDIWGYWIVEASLTPDAARQVLEGRLPSSPLPYLALQLALAAVLLGAGVLLVWRIADLARMRSDFTSSISHELRTPLTQILMYSEMMEMERAESTSERRKAIGIITRETHRLIHLVENILRFSRTEQAGVTLSPKRLRVRALLDEVVSAFRPIADAKGVELHVDGDSAMEVSADDDALRRIVLNLLDNAVKYGPDGQRVVVLVERAGPWVRLSVEDEGPGVAADDRERIWLPFTRLAHGSTTGGGIGLAIVRDLVERHGGRFGVLEGRDGGARFYVDFPVVVAASERSEHRAGIQRL